MPENIFSLLDKIRSIAVEGLTYAKSGYDIERYKKLLSIVSEQYSEISGASLNKAVKNLRKETGCITPKVGVDIAILNENKELLVLKRIDDSAWSLPCGWMDIGEHPIETAKRETKEEAGIDISPLGYIAITAKGPNTYPSIAYHQINILVISKPINKNTKITLSHEHSEYKWIELDENIKWHAGHEILIKPIKKFIESGIYIS